MWKHNEKIFRKKSCNIKRNDYTTQQINFAKNKADNFKGYLNTLFHLKKEDL